MKPPAERAHAWPESRCLPGYRWQELKGWFQQISVQQGVFVWGSSSQSSFVRPRRFLYFSVKKFKYILKIFTINKASIYKTEEPPQMFNRRNMSLCFHIKLVKWIKETHQQVLVFNHLSLAYSGGPWVMSLSLRRLHHWGGSVMMIISHFWQLATCCILVQWKVPNLHHSSSDVFALCKVIQGTH